MSEIYSALASAIRESRPVALVTIIEGENLGRKLLVSAGDLSAKNDVLGGLGDPELDRVVSRDARAELAVGRSVVRRYGARGEARGDDLAVFVESFTTAPRMIVFGAVDFTAALVRAAKLLGYEVTVCDARSVFATNRRFPEADEVVTEWPHEYLERVGPSLTERDAVCVLTHDHKFDVPAVIGALATRVGYIGCMGSRRTHEQRRQRLVDAGVDPHLLDRRVMSPIGLDIGARTPAETAVSICAEIIALTAGKKVPFLRDGTGPIHDGPVD